MANNSTETKVKVQKKSKRQVPFAKLYVLTTPNNTKLTITDLQGEVLCWSNCGVIGFKGSKKSTAYAATKSAEDLVYKAQRFGVHSVYAYLNGFGQGRLAALKGLRGAGIKILQLSDRTSVPHGGITPKKQRKV